MNRKSFLASSLVAATALSIGAAGAALADDSSMSMYTGDSYAFFNGLDYGLGKFNVAHGGHMDVPMAVVKSPAAAPAQKERRNLLATRPTSGARTRPFRDDTGA